MLNGDSVLRCVELQSYTPCVLSDTRSQEMDWNIILFSVCPLGDKINSPETSSLLWNITQGGKNSLSFFCSIPPTLYLSIDTLSLSLIPSSFIYLVFVFSITPPCPPCSFSSSAPPHHSSSPLYSLRMWRDGVSTCSSQQSFLCPELCSHHDMTQSTTWTWRGWRWSLCWW